MPHQPYPAPEQRSPRSRASLPSSTRLCKPRPRPAPGRPIPGSAPDASQWRPRGPAPGRPPRRPPAPARSLRPSGSLSEVGLRRVLLEKKVGFGENPEAGRGRGFLGLSFPDAWAQDRQGAEHAESRRASGGDACARRAGVVNAGPPSS